MQPQRDNRRRVRMAVDAEDAAFLPQPVFVKVGARRLMPVETLVDGGPPYFAKGRTRARRLIAWEPLPEPPGRARARSC